VARKVDGNGAGSWRSGGRPVPPRAWLTAPAPPASTGKRVAGLLTPPRGRRQARAIGATLWGGRNRDADDEGCAAPQALRA
jgi:hypothetical protein